MGTYGNATTKPNGVKYGKCGEEVS